MVYQLADDDCSFPNPYLGEPDGMLAIGGTLSPDRLLTAYSYGIFPWFPAGTMPIWYCPLDRFVIFPEEIHVSHSMRTLINSGRYRVTFNKALREVMEGCSEVDAGSKMKRSDLPGAWLGEDIIEAYLELNRVHHNVRSVEVWEGDRLVGGLYGVIVRGGFMGESMFSRVPNASKLALIHLARQLSATGVRCLIDCQFETPHLLSMGGRHIPYDEYLDILSGGQYSVARPEPE